MDHILKTIETFEAKIVEHEQEIFKLRSAVNQVCAVAGMEPKYQLDDAGTASAATGKTLGTIKADEFFNKPLATAVRNALNMLRAAGKAPASVEQIYDVLVQGGFDFGAKRDPAIQGLHVSIGKNSALFSKLPNGLVGVKDWYGDAPRPRGRGAKDANGKQGDDEQQADGTESAPSQGSGTTTGEPQ